MKLFLISDNSDTRLGMRLAGVEGVVACEKEKFESVFDNAVSDTDTAILIISEKLAEANSEYIAGQKINNRIPLIVYLPDRHGSGRPKDYILSYVRDALGADM